MPLHSNPADRLAECAVFLPASSREPFLADVGTLKAQAAGLQDALLESKKSLEAEADNARLRAALEDCRRLFREIRGDWTDPRSECSDGLGIIAAALQEVVVGVP